VFLEVPVSHSCCKDETTKFILYLHVLAPGLQKEFVVELHKSSAVRLVTALAPAAASVRNVPGCVANLGLLHTAGTRGRVVG
jgi:hypothetical protein